MYMDGLLNRSQHQSLGCMVGNKFFIAFAYVYDTNPDCPSYTRLAEKSLMYVNHLQLFIMCMFMLIYQ